LNSGTPLAPVVEEKEKKESGERPHQDRWKPFSTPHDKTSRRYEMFALKTPSTQSVSRLTTVISLLLNDMHRFRQARHDSEVPRDG
jgi:hypothetical protein